MLMGEVLLSMQHYTTLVSLTQLYLLVVYVNILCKTIILAYSTVRYRHHWHYKQAAFLLSTYTFHSIMGAAIIILHCTISRLSKSNIIPAYNGLINMLSLLHSVLMAGASMQ